MAEVVLWYLWYLYGFRKALLYTDTSGNGSTSLSPLGRVKNEPSPGLWHVAALVAASADLGVMQNEASRAVGECLLVVI